MLIKDKRLIFLLALGCWLPCLSDHSLSQNLDFHPILMLKQAIDCSKTEELVYRSTKLASSNGSTSVYFDVTLRRFHGKVINSICYGKEDTPVLSMVLEKEGVAESIDFNFLQKDYLIVPEPLSFSPDGRYLIFQFDNAEANVITTTISVFDTVENTTLSFEGKGEIKYCIQEDTLQVMEFDGFLSESIFKVNCEEIYARKRDETTNFSEKVNIKTRRTEKTYDIIKTSRSFGWTQEHKKIIQRQIFD